MALAKRLSKQGETKFAETFSSHVYPLFTLLLTPIGINRNTYAMDTSLFLRPSGVTFSSLASQNVTAQPLNGSATNEEAAQAQRPAKRRRRSEKNREVEPVSSHNIDSPIFLGDVELVGFETMMRMKIAGAKAMGYAMSLWPSSQIMTFKDILIQHLGSASDPPTFSMSRIVVAMVFEEYGSHVGTEQSEFRALFTNQLFDILNAPSTDHIYRDMAPFLKVVRSQTQALLNVFSDTGRLSSHKLPRLAVVVKGEADAGPDAFSLTDAEKAITTEMEKLKKSIQASYRFAIMEPLKVAQDSLQNSIDDTKQAIELRNIRVNASVAGAYIAFLSTVPKKLNPVIRSLMDSVKEEENFDMQKRAANAVAILVDRCSIAGKAGASDKMIKNLCAFLCVDTSEVPEFHHHEKLDTVILSLHKEEDRRDPKDVILYQREIRKARTKRRGAKTTLENLADMFGAQLFTKVPKLRECMINPLIALREPLPESITSPESTVGQEIVDGMSIIRALVPRIHTDLLDVLVDYYQLIGTALRSSFSVLRYAAAKSLAAICSVMKVKGMTYLVEHVLPMFNNGLDMRCRQGAVECVYHLVQVMEHEILPYVVFLVVPILGRMSDSDNDIRLLATTTFAQLIKLVPLEVSAVITLICDFFLTDMKLHRLESLILLDSHSLYLKAVIASVNSSHRCLILPRLSHLHFQLLSKLIYASTSKKVSTG